MQCDAVCVARKAILQYRQISLSEDGICTKKQRSCPKANEFQKAHFSLIFIFSFLSILWVSAAANQSSTTPFFLPENLKI